MVLPNGRNVVLASKEGADEFVDNVGTDFISTSLTATDGHELTFVYTIMVAFAENASQEKIASGIPESELRTFIEHTRNTLRTQSQLASFGNSVNVSLNIATGRRWLLGTSFVPRIVSF